MCGVFDDIAFRDDARKRTPVHDEERPDVALGHLLGSVEERLVARDAETLQSFDAQ
jgi:hypothetical protein